MAESAEAPITVTIKGDGAAPWIVVRADDTVAAAAVLNDVIDSGLDGTVAVAARSLASTYSATAAGVQPGGVSPAQTAVANTLGGTTISDSAQQTQQTFAGSNPEFLTDKFGRGFEFNHPKAPHTAHGPAVLMHAKSQNGGKQYSKWLDPRAKAVPGNYEKGVRADPLDPAPFENDGFARGVTWRGQ